MTEIEFYLQLRNLVYVLFCLLIEILFSKKQNPDRQYSCYCVWISLHHRQHQHAKPGLLQVYTNWQASKWSKSCLFLGCFFHMFSYQKILFLKRIPLQFVTRKTWSRKKKTKKNKNSLKLHSFFYCFNTQSSSSSSSSGSTVMVLPEYPRVNQNF